MHVWSPSQRRWRSTLIGSFRTADQLGEEDGAAEGKGRFGGAGPGIKPRTSALEPRMERLVSSQKSFKGPSTLEVSKGLASLSEEFWAPRAFLSIFSGSGNNLRAPQHRHIHFLPKDEPRTFGKRRAPTISQTEKRSHLQAAVTRGDD